MADSSTEVIIVGAGPTGLTAAGLLQRMGVSVRIFDKNPSAVHETRAFGIHARSMELFLSMGLAEKFLDRGLIATGIQIFVNGRQTAELNFDDIGRPDTPYPFVLMVPQSEIEEILADDLRERGIEVERGAEVTSCEQSADGVVARGTKQGQPFEVHGRYLVGADGAHSIVRKTLGLRFDGAPYPQGFLLADCKIDWPLDYSHLKLFLHGRVLAAFLPLRGREVSRIIVIQSPDKEFDPSLEAQGSSDVSFAEVQEAFREATTMDVKLSDPVWLSRYRVHHRGVDRYRVGRMFVAGDSAHIHSPAGGQGMNTGLQDVANLAWKLALVLQGGAPDALLDTYHTERWPIGQNVLNFTDRLFGVISSQTGWVAQLRNLLVPVLSSTLSKSGTVRNKAFHFVSQLGIRYYESPFVRDDPSPDAPRAWLEGLTAGHRAPDGLVARDHDVFDLIGSYAWHVLALSRRPLDAHEIDRLANELDNLARTSPLHLATHIVAHSLVGRHPRITRAESPQVFEHYGITNESLQGLFLIRPDGYIAYRSDRLDIAALEAFVKTGFGREASG